MLFALKIYSHGHHQALAPEVLAIDDQGYNVARNRSLREGAQFSLGQGFPVPAHAGLGDAVAFNAIIDGSGIVARGNLPAQISTDCLLQWTFLLEGFVSRQRKLRTALVSHARFIDGHLAPGKDDIAGLGSVAISLLLAAGSAQSGDLLVEHAPDYLQSDLGNEPVQFCASVEDHVQERSFQAD